MNMYKVIKSFRDKEDNFRTYRRGETIPAKGKEVSQERLDELSGSDNDRKEPVIEWEQPPTDDEGDGEGAEKDEGKDPEDEGSETDEFPNHVGGGYFELSNGDKVKGKEDAIKAEKELK